MRRKALLAAAILGAAIQLSFAQKLLQNKDSFSGATAYFTEMRQPKLEGGSFMSGRYVNMRFEAFSPVTNTAAPYAIFVTTQTPGWVFISAGPSLLLKLDGQEMLTLTGSGSKDMRSVLSGDTVTESAFWSLTQAQLKRIVQAKKVEFRILGDREIITGEWKPDLLRDAAYFAAEIPKFLHPEGAVSALVLESMKADAQQTCPNAIRPVDLGPPVKMGTAVTSVTKPVADSLHLPSASGMFVLHVTSGSPAEASGIRVGDVVTKFGETAVVGKCDLFDALAQTRAEQTVAVSMLRQQGTIWEAWTANVKLSTEPAAAPAPALVPTTAPSAAPGGRDVYTELLKLDELRKKGIITDAEFAAQKQKILNGN